MASTTAPVDAVPAADGPSAVPDRPSRHRPRRSRRRPTSAAGRPPAGRTRPRTTLGDHPALAALVAMAVVWLTVPGLFERTVAGHDLRGADALRALAVFALAFFPGWLLVRFVRRRGPALRIEYVVNLHRLLGDARSSLPAPPAYSAYYRLWRQARQQALAGHDGPAPADRDNLYLHKFESSYGALHHVDTAFPVLLLTAVFAAGWAAVLADDDLYTGPPVGLARVLVAAFAGAYLFILQMLIRRYFQNDIKPSAYVSAFARLVTVLVLVVVLYQTIGARPGWSDAAVVAVAFTIGFFPVAGLLYLRNLATAVLGHHVGSLGSRYPLNELDGLNLWYETRLLEEGIEDMAELVNANLVDVLLHTRVPAGRLVDWLDQAHLYLHLPPCENWGDSPHPRDLLRRAGIVNATDLLAAFDSSDDGDGAEGPPPVPASPGDLAAWIERATAGSPAGPVQLSCLVRILRHHTGLAPVRCWRAGTGPPAVIDLATAGLSRSDRG